MFIGVMSGTSCDGIDVAVADFKQGHRLKHLLFKPYPYELREKLLAIIAGQRVCVEQINRIDAELGLLYATAINQLLEQHKLTAKHITAIGLHGQTIHHSPNPPLPNSWQIGSPTTVASLTQIPVVANFRQLDICYGGQGAPLAAALHRELFAHLGAVAVVNLGGIANLSYFSNDIFIGFDTGPANCLMDLWAELHTKQKFDKNGAWAAQGKINNKLLQRFMDDAYFARSYPKSTGRERFNHSWLMAKLGTEQIVATDVQASLLQLTACSIAKGIQLLPEKVKQVIVCGGGTHNQQLIKALATETGLPINSCAKYGFDPDHLESMLMAWLAFCYCNNRKLDLQSITGCQRPLRYGVAYRP